MNVIFSVIVVSYNHKKWFEKLFESFKAQTIFDLCELIVVDNDSADGTDELCANEFKSWNGRGRFVRSGGNLGFGSAQNVGAGIARGEYLFFVSPDVWFEADCMEQFLQMVGNSRAEVYSAVELKYVSNEPQPGSHGYGSPGFDIFGCTTSYTRTSDLDNMFAIGSFYFMKKSLFVEIGGFDEQFFVYGEEMDMSWRAQIAGAKIKTVEGAKIHHAACGCTSNTGQLHEWRRFYANRNQLLLILKNSNSFLLIMAFNYMLLIAAESFIGALLARQPSFFWWSFVKPVSDCFRLKEHILNERRKIVIYRKLGDLDITKSYFKFSFGHWQDIKRFLSLKVSHKPFNTTYKPNPAT